MAITVTPGYSHASGGLVTPTRLNTAISGLSIAAGAKKVIGTTSAGAVAEIAYSDDGLVLLQGTKAQQQAALEVGGARAIVTTQFDKTDTTLANITGLSATLEAGKTYGISAVIFVSQDTQPAVGKSKFALSGTATATSIKADFTHIASGVSPQMDRVSSLGSPSSVSLTSQSIRCVIDGSIVVNAGGTLTVQFAQATASGTSSVLVGSYLSVWPYA